MFVLQGPAIMLGYLAVSGLVLTRYNASVIHK